MFFAQVFDCAYRCREGLACFGFYLELYFCFFVFKPYNCPIFHLQRLQHTYLMAKHLMIVESPAKAKTIEKYLGKDFTVRASYGHVRDLPKGNDAIDIKNHFAPKYEVLPEKKKVINELKAIIKEVDTVWLATDEDREGEAISWHLALALGLDISSTNRVVFNEITKNAVTKAIQNPRTIDLNLVNAQQARRVLDRLVGFELSPLLWRKVRSGLSAGRVQSVSVRLLVEREREILNFVPTSSYQVQAEFQTEKNEKFRAALTRKISDSKGALQFLNGCLGATYKVSNIEKKPAKRSPSAPFTTSTLQQEASRKLSFPVAITMKVAQSLYESGKITYMRTDSVNLSDTALQQAEAVITQQFGQNYHQLRKFKTKSAGAQEAHEAIRPTDFSVSQIAGNRDEQRLYELIWKRAMASQMADAQLERTLVDIAVSTQKEQFRAEGEVIKFDGFLKLYMESTDDEDDEDGHNSLLPAMQVGQALDLLQMTATERFTKPNPRYTEASLVKKLEELGIGRPSTYAPTISTIQQRDYATKESREGVKREYQVHLLKTGKITSATKTEMVGTEKNKLFPTDLGMLVTDFLALHFVKIMDYSFTANVEEEFDKIAEGKLQWQNMMSTFYDDFEQTVQKVGTEAERAKSERYLGDDPQSGKPVYAKVGKNGSMVQIGSAKDEEKPRFASLKQNQRIDTISLAEALELFTLPRALGEYEGMKVKAAIGKFGPYVQVGTTFVSLKQDSPYDITLERAIECYVEKLESDKKKVLKRFSDDIQVLMGRWNKPYLKYGKENIALDKDVDVQAMTLADCERLLDEHKNGAPKAMKPNANAIHDFGEVQVLNGRYGPYIKMGKDNYKIPKGVEAESLTREACLEIVKGAKK